MTGFEPLIGAAAAGLGGLITSLVKDKGTETLKKIDWDIGKNLAVKKALVDYVRRYIDRHGTLKVACVRMDYPVRLDEIYTAVQLLDRWQASQYFADEDALQEQYRESGKRGFNVTRAEKKPGLQVANEQQYLMVLGGPGVGKSTFLRKVGLEALKSLNPRVFPPPLPPNRRLSASYPAVQVTPADKSAASTGISSARYQHSCIPVMLELRQFDKANVSIQAVIAAELETCGFPHPEELTELFLKNGKLLVLLDGLDEVPSATLNYAITEIENLVDRHSDNRYIASCRVAAYTFGGFRRFKDVAMAAFEDEQIQQFIKNWFQKERDAETNTAERCWELLNSKDYQAAKELAQTPLLLTLLCVVYDEFQDFPKKRHALYGEALDVLLRKWASEKRIQRNPIYRELSAELELDMLAEIAYTSFVDGQLFFPKDRLTGQIREFLVDNLNAPSHLDAETVLKEIEIQQGILVERARDAYSFSHLTFQEYLAAKYIIENQKTQKIVSHHVSNEQWREVFLLISGLSLGKQGADDLLLAMEKQAGKHARSGKIKDIIFWATTSTQLSDGDIIPAAKRVAAIFLIHMQILNDYEAFFNIKLEDMHLEDDDLFDDEDLSFDFDEIRQDDFNSSLIIDQELSLVKAFDSRLAKSLARLKSFDHDRSHDLYIDISLDFELDLALDLMFDLAKDYQELGIFNSELTERLTRALEDLSDQLSMLKDSDEDRSFFARSIKKALFESFHCYRENFHFSKNQASSIKQYFYILELMVRCKEAAVRVSPQVWAGIESRMVTVPE